MTRGTQRHRRRRLEQATAARARARHRDGCVVQGDPLVFSATRGRTSGGGYMIPPAWAGDVLKHVQSAVSHEHAAVLAAQQIRQSGDALARSCGAPHRGPGGLGVCDRCQTVTLENGERVTRQELVDRNEHPHDLLPPIALRAGDSLTITQTIQQT